MYSKLYLVRHGQTVFNTRLLIQGRCDSPLTDLGRDQARAAAAWLRERGVAPAAAFSSPAERACGTMELLWAGPYMQLEGLRERSFGELEGTGVLALPKPMGDYPAQFGGELQADLEERLSRTMTGIMRGSFSSGSTTAVAGRSDAAIEPCALTPRAACDGAAAREGADDGEVLVVSHGAACKAFAHAWEDTARVELPSPFPNCCVLVYEFDGEKFTLVETDDPAASLGGAGLPI